VGGAGDFGAANGHFLGNSNASDDADEDFVDDGGQGNENDGGGADNLDDGASGSSGGSGEIAPGGRTRPSGERATVRASPVSSTGHERGEASGQSRRASVADAAVEAMLPGGGDLTGFLVASLSDGARRFDEKQKTKCLVALEAWRTTREAMLTAAIEKHPDNETFRDMLKAAMWGDSS